MSQAIVSRPVSRTLLWLFLSACTVLAHADAQRAPQGGGDGEKSGGGGGGKGEGAQGGEDMADVERMVKQVRERLTHPKKKDLSDYTEEDLEKLYDQWEVMLPQLLFLTNSLEFLRRNFIPF